MWKKEDAPFSHGRDSQDKTLLIAKSDNYGYRVTLSRYSVEKNTKK